MVDVVSSGDHHNFALLQTNKGNGETAKVGDNAWDSCSGDIRKVTPKADGGNAEVVDDMRSICLGEAGNPWAPRCTAQKRT